MMQAARLPHVRLAMVLMLGTAARISALLELTWDRVDFQRKLIHLRDPKDTAHRKGRAIVPMNGSVLAALQEARTGALTDYVIEWKRQPVKSIKRAIGFAAARAGISGVSPHVYRHTAAVWMAEAGVPIPEISQYLGHSNMSITERVYAKFSPTYLRNAAQALEMPTVRRA